MNAHLPAGLWPDNIGEMEAALTAAGSSVAQLCERAGIAQSTWWRWKTRSISPTLRVWARVLEVYGQITATPEAAA